MLGTGGPPSPAVMFRHGCAASRAWKRLLTFGVAGGPDGWLVAAISPTTWLPFLNAIGARQR
jgi:hypothetical protein